MSSLILSYVQLTLSKEPVTRRKLHGLDNIPLILCNVSFCSENDMRTKSVRHMISTPYRSWSTVFIRLQNGIEAEGGYAEVHLSYITLCQGN